MLHFNNSPFEHFYYHRSDRYRRFHFPITPESRYCFTSLFHCSNKIKNQSLMFFYERLTSDGRCYAMLPICGRGFWFPFKRWGGCSIRMVKQVDSYIALHFARSLEKGLQASLRTLLEERIVIRREGIEAPATREGCSYPYTGRQPRLKEFFR